MLNRVELLKIAIVSGLFVLMAYSSLIFKHLENVDYQHTFITYDKSCDCHNSDVVPVNQKTYPMKWVAKDVSIFTFGLIMAIIGMIGARIHKWIWLMWILFISSLIASYLISNETLPLDKYLHPIVCTIQVAYCLCRFLHNEKNISLK